MMYDINPYVEVFKMARDMMATKGAPMNLKLCFITSRTKDARQYNVPTADEIILLEVSAPEFKKTLCKSLSRPSGRHCFR